MEKKERLEIAFYWEDASDTEGARGPASEKSVPFQSNGPAVGCMRRKTARSRTGAVGGLNFPLCTELHCA